MSTRFAQHYLREELFFYSPYNCLRALPAGLQWEALIMPKLAFFSAASEKNIVLDIEVDGQLYFFLLDVLSWDTAFFGMPTYKLYTVLYPNHDFAALSQAIARFKEAFFGRQERRYCFIEIPAEDSLLLAALSGQGFRLTETRGLYYRADLPSFAGERFDVRPATEQDIPALRHIAASARNRYDRFHAEPAYSPQLADDFLASFAEQSQRGFTDIVLVPDEPSQTPCAFMAIRNLRHGWDLPGCSLSRIVLSAATTSCKGWHYRLMTESMHYAREQGSDYMLMTTQLTNRAVIRNCEKLKFSLGSSSHILSHYH